MFNKYYVIKFYSLSPMDSRTLFIKDCLWDGKATFKSYEPLENNGLIRIIKRNNDGSVEFKCKAMYKVYDEIYSNNHYHGTLLHIGEQYLDIIERDSYNIYWIDAKLKPNDDYSIHKILKDYTKIYVKNNFKFLLEYDSKNRDHILKNIINNNNIHLLSDEEINNKIISLAKTVDEKLIDHKYLKYKITYDGKFILKNGNKIFNIIDLDRFSKEKILLSISTEDGNKLFFKNYIFNLLNDKYQSEYDILSEEEINNKLKEALKTNFFNEPFLGKHKFNSNGEYYLINEPKNIKNIFEILDILSLKRRILFFSFTKEGNEIYKEYMHYYKMINNVRN